DALHLGLTPAINGNLVGPLPTLQLPLALELPLVKAAETAPPVLAGIGLRYPSAFGWVVSGHCIAGRPLRDAAGAPLPAALRVLAERPAAPTADAATSAALAAAWFDDARAECASVPAFLALARDLLACGAPHPLVSAAICAAGDE